MGDEQEMMEEEPAEVAMARGELKVLTNERKKIDKLRSNVSKDLEIARQKAVLLEEV